MTDKEISKLVKTINNHKYRSMVLPIEVLKEMAECTEMISAQNWSGCSYPNLSGWLQAWRESAGNEE